MRIQKIIPDMLTFSNIILGFLSIIFSLRNDFFIAAVLLLAAVVCDFLDGKVARFLSVETKLGSQLDSLCDVVSFGVAPAVFMNSFFQSNLLLVLGALFVAAGAFRLARFNVMKDKVEGFIGMPITLNGIIFPVIYFAGASLAVVAAVFVLSSILMVATFHVGRLF